MANIIIDHSPQPFPISSDRVCAIVSDAKDRADILAALSTYDELQATARRLALVMEATDARDKLVKAGVFPFDEQTFRSVYLERLDLSAMHRLGWDIDRLIVEQLTEKATVVIRRIRQRAAGWLEANFPRPGSDELAKAARLGLADDAAYSPLYHSMRRVREDIVASLDQPINLQNNGDRRSTLGRFFAKPL